MTTTKTFSQASENNKKPILQVIREVFADATSLLEIGSGTGQHAVFFSAHLTQLTWQCSDLPENHPSINAWLTDINVKNCLTPFSLDVCKQQQWPEQKYDAAFSANTAHIMSWLAVEAMFNGLGKLLLEHAAFCQYGPFNYGSKFTSESNRQFDNMLKARDPLMGIRDMDLLHELAKKNNFKLEADHEMPVNNRLLVWRKI